MSALRPAVRMPSRRYRQLRMQSRVTLGQGARLPQGAFPRPLPLQDLPAGNRADVQIVGFVCQKFAAFDKKSYLCEIKLKTDGYEKQPYLVCVGEKQLVPMRLRAVIETSVCPRFPYRDCPQVPFHHPDSYIVLPSGMVPLSLSTH